MPVYCGEEEHETYLAEALDSVARQTFRDFEVILVDDASPRDIQPIISGIPNLPEVRVIRSETNYGHAQSRSLGVLAARSEFVAFLDHDDLWSPDKLELQVAQMRQNPDVGMVFCSVNTFGPYADRLSIDQSIIPKEPTFLWFINHGNYVITASAALVRRDVLLDIGLFDARYSTCDDFDAWLKIARRHRIIYLPQQLAHYRLHSLNANYGVDRLNDNRLLTTLLIDYWLGAPLPEKLLLIPRILRKFIGRLYFHIFRYRRFRD